MKKIIVLLSMALAFSVYAEDQAEDADRQAADNDVAEDVSEATLKKEVKRLEVALNEVKEKLGIPKKTPSNAFFYLGQTNVIDENGDAAATLGGFQYEILGHKECGVDDSLGSFLDSSDFGQGCITVIPGLESKPIKQTNEAGEESLIDLYTATLDVGFGLSNVQLLDKINEDLDVMINFKKSIVASDNVELDDSAFFERSVRVGSMPYRYIEWGDSFLTKGISTQDDDKFGEFVRFRVKFTTDDKLQSGFYFEVEAMDYGLAAPTTDESDLTLRIIYNADIDVLSSIIGM